MLVEKTPHEIRGAVARMDRPLGFVPTMGALHRGHLALIAAAREQCGTAVASIFVNPLQFGLGEDYELYPRDPQGDLRLLKESGVGAVFVPEANTMFPADFSTSIGVGEISTTFEGSVRPNHFQGVATVVVKLLNIIAPDVVFFGQKDAQQTAVIRKVVRDLNVAVEVRLVATVRESDGLALSSRNRYLSMAERAAAPTLYAALQEAHRQLRSGCPALEALAAGKTLLHPLAKLDYMALVDAERFEPLTRLRPPAFIIAAAAFGTTRLIDNIWVPA